jgi:hypothetical protein
MKCDDLKLAQLERLCVRLLRRHLRECTGRKRKEKAGNDGESERGLGSEHGGLSSRSSKIRQQSMAATRKANVGEQWA